MHRCAYSGGSDFPVRRLRRATGSPRPEPVANIRWRDKGYCNAHSNRKWSQINVPA